MVEEEIKFYMQEVDKDYVPKEGTLKDLEVDFKGLRYSSCSGFDSVGDIKNTYEEDYKDSDGVRAYIPSVPAYSATDMKLTIFFIGEDRCEVRDNFISYISKGLHSFWDTKRYKKAYVYLKDKIELEDSSWKGSIPYLKYTFTLRNVLGRCVNMNLQTEQ